MKYGCRDDPALKYIETTIVIEESILLATSFLNSTENMPSPLYVVEESILSDFTQNTEDMPSIASGDVFMEHYNTDNVQIELFKATIIELQQQVCSLNSDIIFFKDEITKKNNVIDYLILTNGHKKSVRRSSTCTQNSSSLFLANVMDENIRRDKDYEHRNVTVRRKTNPADMNIWSSDEDEADAVESEDNLSMKAERPQNKLTTQLEEVRVEKHEKYKNIKQLDNINKTGDDTYSLGAWEVHNNGFASKVMKKYGYSGKGLGKREDGIIEPIQVKQKSRFDDEDTEIPNANIDSMVHAEMPEEPTDVYLWPANTVLIAGDSMLHGINEKRMSKKLNVKVRPHSGATIRDTFDHLKALLRKKPKYLIIHAGANDATNNEKSADTLYNEIIRLKNFATSLVPGIIVTISCPIVRRDNGPANIKVIHLRHKLRKSGLNIISNDSVTYDHLGKKGLHLTQRGIGRLAMNMIDFMKRLYH